MIRLRVGKGQVAAPYDDVISGRFKLFCLCFVPLLDKYFAIVPLGLLKRIEWLNITIDIDIDSHSASLITSTWFHMGFIKIIIRKLLLQKRTAITTTILNDNSTLLYTLNSHILLTILAHARQHPVDLRHRWALRGIHSPAHPYYFPQIIAHCFWLQFPKYTVMPLVGDLHEALAVRVRL